MEGVGHSEWAKAHFFVAPALFQRMRPEVISKIEEIAARVGRSEGIEIVDVELKGGGRNQFLRISIDKPEGVTHADCELISHQLGTILDVEDVIPNHYTLEVSSPGVERKLRNAADFERFRGKKARIVLRDPVDNQRHWEGILGSMEEGLLTLESAGGKNIRVPLEQVEKANLKFEW